MTISVLKSVGHATLFKKCKCEICLGLEQRKLRCWRSALTKHCVPYMYLIGIPYLALEISQETADSRFTFTRRRLHLAYLRVTYCRFIFVPHRRRPRCVQPQLDSCRFGYRLSVRENIWRKVSWTFLHSIGQRARTCVFRIRRPNSHNFI